jgi:hypothetical protein
MQLEPRRNVRLFAFEGARILPVLRLWWALIEFKGQMKFV